MNQLRRHIFVGLAAALFAFAIAGCGHSAARQVGSVEGTVKHQGNPVTGGFIVFSNLQAGVVQSARLEADGRYRIPQIPVGDYTVYFSDPPPPGPDEEQQAAPPQPINVPPNYKSAQTSGLSAKVSAGRNVIDFTLE